METASFHLGDILSALHLIMVAPKKMEGLIAMFSFMTDMPITFKHEMEAAGYVCLPALRERFPQLLTSEMQESVRQLKARLKREPDEEKCRELVFAWLAEQEQKHGSLLPVRALPLSC